MIWSILFGIFFLLATIVLGWLVRNKWTQLRVLDPESVPESLFKKKKQELLRQRIERTGKRYAQGAQKKVIRPVGEGLQTAFRRFAGKLTAAERRYQQEKHKQAAREGDLRVVEGLLDEGRAFMEEKVYDQAEKKFIQAIGLDARNADAYELLGRVYLALKDYDSAKQTFAFLNKIHPEDASVIASLGEVEQWVGNHEQAQSYFEKAVELSPRNPKYLDLWIESIIALVDVHKAMTALDRLIEVNPENKKIPEFERRIDALRKKRK